MALLGEIVKQDEPNLDSKHEALGLHQRFLEQQSFITQTTSSQKQLEVTDPAPSGTGITDKVMAPEPGPNIEWLPSYETYMDRVERLGARHVSKLSNLPGGYPNTIQGPRNWTGSEFKDKSKYIITLSEKDVREVEQALQHFISKWFKVWRNATLIRSRSSWEQ